jgi:glutamate synthase domain-containing protein 2
MANNGDLNGDDRAGTPDSAANYIAALTQELAQLARRNGLDTLGYILEMARLEAEQVTKD